MFSFFQTAFDTFMNAAIALLPTSPFTSFLSEFSNIPYLGYFNWFVPVGACMRVSAAWLTSIAAFYIIQALLRWLKVIGD